MAHDVNVRVLPPVRVAPTVVNLYVGPPRVRTHEPDDMVPVPLDLIRDVRQLVMDEWGATVLWGRLNEVLEPYEPREDDPTTAPEDPQ